MSLLTSYSAGTVSVGAGSMTVTGSGTAWSTAGVEAGDYFWAAGLSVRIASVNSNTSLTLAYPWPGAALSGANYEVQFTPDATRNLASARAVLTQLTNGNISALGGLATAPDTLAYYTGSGVAALTGLTSAARSLLDDASVSAMRSTLGVSAASAGSTYGAYGGSANAITVTAGLASLAVGTQIRFRATAANTGAATLNLDGLGARACRTVTGVALPAGYIRTDEDTVAIYDGTYWVLYWLSDQRGGNSNGAYVRSCNGSQRCELANTAGNNYGPVTTATGGGGGYISSPIVRTFPAAFVSIPTVAPCAARQVADTVVVMSVANTITTTGFTQYLWCATSLSPSGLSATYIAVGAWY